MKRSTNRILTTHVGSLPRVQELAEIMRAIGKGDPYDAARRGELVKAAVSDAVRKQVEHGVDIINDGEMGKPGFITYANDRLGGFEPAPPNEKSQWSDTRESISFPEFYKATSPARDDRLRMICTGPISYIGERQLQEEIQTLKSALTGFAYEEVFVPSVSPSMLALFQRNAFYKTEEEFVFAVAEAMREEYKAIVDAGFIVQIDDPGMLAHFLRNPAMTLDSWRRWASVHIEAVNHALRGIPPEKVRHHTCHGINMGPRLHDMEFKDYIDLVLRINAGGYSFEAANPRHEHEWRIWETVKLPEGKVIIPGVITQSTVLIEHPELVADRIERYANLVGRENVIASTDCGFASTASSDEIHPRIVWAKFEALVEGARLASNRLWKKARIA